MSNDIDVEHDGCCGMDGAGARGGEGGMNTWVLRD